MRFRFARGWVVLVPTLLLLLAPGSRLLAAGPVVPDAACQDEGKSKSLKGDTTAALTVINNSDEVVQTFWLDYNGDRVLYEQVAPHTSYVQKTWLTHPWVVASASGACYRFVVMNAREQTVTVAPANPDPAATVRAVPTATPPLNAPTAGPTVGPATTPAAASGTAPGDTSAFSWPLILGITASFAALLIGAGIATGRMPWINRGGPPRR